MNSSRPELAMVVPCYNEEGVLGFTVPQLAKAFAAEKIAVELILVDNGSSDRTGAIIAGFVEDGLPVKPVRVEKNIGYGNGILRGIAVADADFIGMIPADGQVDAEDVVKLYQVLAQAGPGLMAKVRRRFRLDGFSRKIISVCYNLFVFLLYPNLGSIDVNGSPKILPAEALKRMELESCQWFLDPEIMVKAKVLGLRVLEMNVFAQMRSAGTSHVRMGTCWEFFSKLIGMRFGRGIRDWKKRIQAEAHAKSEKWANFLILPYHYHQAGYFALSLVVTLIIWFSLRRLAKQPLRRMLWCVGGQGGLMLFVALATGFAPGGSNTLGFMIIALAYYAFGIILPILGLLQLRRSKVTALLSAFVLGVSLWAALVEPNRLQARTETIRVERFNAGREIRIAHISDLQTVGHCDREDRAQAIINAFEPDLILFSGDYIAGPFENPEPAMEAARNFLKGLKARLGIVVVDGHAEPRILREKIFEGLPLYYLKDQEKIFQLEDGRKLRIFGSMVHDPRLDLIQAPADADELTILVSHMPDQSMEIQGRGVDIHLAGHTHGGQIVIPGYGAPLTLSSMPRQYARGLHRYEDHWLNVSAGIGMEGNHAPRLRLFCPPEICLLRIEGVQSAENR